MVWDMEPDGQGWEPNVDVHDNGFWRGDLTEEMHWRRLKTHAEQEEAADV